MPSDNGDSGPVGTDQHGSHADGEVYEGGTEKLASRGTRLIWTRLVELVRIVDEGCVHGQGPQTQGPPSPWTQADGRAASPRKTD